MSHPIGDYLKKYIETDKKDKLKKKKTKKNNGLLIVDDIIPIKLTNDNVKSSTNINVNQLNEKIAIKNGIEAIEETKRNHKALMMSKYSKDNFITINNKANDMVEMDRKIDDNPLQPTIITNNNQQDNNSSINCEKNKLKSQLSTSINKDSDDDLDIERPSSNVHKVVQNRKRIISDAQIIKTSDTNNIDKNSVYNNEDETVYRDRKTGKKIDLKLEKIEQRRIEERQMEIAQQYQQWGKGLKQLEDKTKKYEDDLYEMSKPLNRYADDKDLENYLKNQQRPDDPLFEYLNKKKQKKLKSSQKHLENQNVDTKPKYQGIMPEPNRFGILPGYRWDGVDRSNGFERKRFQCIAERKALNYESYKWDVEEM